jgi:hypothetical protein
MRLRQSRIAAALTTVLIGLVFQPLTTALAASVQATEEDFAAMAPAQSLAEIVPPAGRLRLTAQCRPYAADGEGGGGTGQ